VFITVSMALSMSRFHLVRVGALGNVGRFWSVDAACYARGQRVIVRTDRGLEVGEVLAPTEEVHRRLADGVILRRMTVEDELLQARLCRNRDEAYAACTQRLREKGLDVLLLDVEHLFDGQSLYFYFLGPVTPEVEALSAELAEVYEAQVGYGRFVEAATAGCGPGCGTPEAAARACGSCASGCSLAGYCRSPHV
jgi:hypothetical protein